MVRINIKLSDINVDLYCIIGYNIIYKIVMDCFFLLVVIINRKGVFLK